MGPETISLPYLPLPDQGQREERRGKEKKILEIIPWRAVAVALSLLCLLTVVSINRHDINLQLSQTERLEEQYKEDLQELYKVRRGC